MSDCDVIVEEANNDHPFNDKNQSDKKMRVKLFQIPKNCWNHQLLLDP